jgi:pimeloyl-ACP methyl ester carboxylesterase
MTRRIDLGTITLSVTEIGDGPPILFLHGFPENGAAWRKVAKPLADRCRCIMPDQRGYGLSDKPDAVEDYAIDRLIADIDALADALDVGGFALAGHDWGGLLAWWYAARRAERLSYLIIANAPHPVLFQKALIDDPAQRLASQYVARLRVPGSEARLPGVTTGMVNWYRAAPFVVPLPDETASVPPWIRAEQFAIDVPTLVLWGMQDTALLPSLLEGLEAYVPDLTVHRFDEAGHSIIHEIPNEISAAIDGFLT